MRLVSILALMLAVSCARCAEPKLTKDLGERVRAGSGKLTEEEVLKLFPGPVKVVLDGADRTLKWDEMTFIELSLRGGKVVSAAAEFNDTVVAKRVTMDKFKQIKVGMAQEEVEKLLGKPNRSSSSRDARSGVTRTTLRWSEGRRIFCTVKNGRVSAPCGWIEER